MGDEGDAPSDAEIEAITRAVEAGEDTIAVPAELLEEPVPPAPPAPRSLYAQIIHMGIAEKIKLALRGNKDARMILVRDRNKVIRRCVIQNPRLTDGEVIGICRDRSADEDALRTIAERREWMRNYQVRLTLATNPKTPAAIALRQLPTLGERDIRQLAKSKNVPQAIAGQCRRMVLMMRDRG